MSHFFSNCPYVTEAMRPSVWAWDLSNQAKFDEKINNNPGFKETIERVAENGNKKHANKYPPPASANPLGFFICDTRSAHALRETASSFSLGATPHACNDRSRISNFQPVEGSSGILGYGTVSLHASTVTDDGPRMILKDVAFAPHPLQYIFPKTRYEVWVCVEW